MSVHNALKRTLRKALGRSVVWDIESSVRKLHPEAMRLSAPDALPAVLANLRDRRQETEIDVDVEIGRPGTAVSYIPYLASGTGFVVHNFFAHNYAIRDPVLYRVVLLDGNRPVATRQFVLGPDETEYVADAGRFLGLESAAPENGILVVSAHHPRIATPAGQLRYFGIYTSRRGQAGCHSMTASARELPRGRIGYRAMGPQSDLDAHRIHVVSLGSDVFDLEKAAPIPWNSADAAPEFYTGRTTRSYFGIDGYFVATDAAGACTAIWHDGAMSHRLSNAAPGPGSARTALGLPRFNDHAPVALIDTDQIGRDCPSVSITLLGNDGKILANCRVDNLPAPRCVIDLAEIFVRERPAITDAVAVFDFGFDSRPMPAPAELMVHAYYRDAVGIQDQTHTIRTIARSLEDNPSMVSSRSRKFCPLIVDASRKTAFSLYNLAAYGELPETEFTLRFFTNRDGEILSRVRLPANGTGVFWAHDFLPRDNETRVGAIWIEHPKVNAAAHWYLFDNSGGGPATDHFTGG